MSLEHARLARRHLVEPRSRSLGWWGAVLGLIALMHLVGAIGVAAVYLRAASPTWPPSPIEAPGMTSSALAAGLLVVAAALATVADVATRRGRGIGAPLLLLAAVAAGAAAALRGSVTIFADHPVTEHAFWSVRWLVGAIDVTLAVTLVIMLLVAAATMVRDRVRPGLHAELAVVTLWSWATAVFVWAMWFVMMGVSVWWGGG